MQNSAPAIPRPCVPVYNWWNEALHGAAQHRLRERFSDALDRRMADVQHGWWFSERMGAEPELFGVFESNANVLCPDAPVFCSPEIGSWPHTALLCRVEREAPSVPLAAT